MPTENEFDSAMDKIRDYIVRLGDDIDEELESDVEIDDEIHRVRGFHAIEATQNCYYSIFGRTDQESLILKYDYDLVESYSSVIETGDLPDEVESDLDISDPRESAKQLINNINDADMRRLKFHLNEEISNPQTYSRINENENVVMEGFSIKDHIFPFEENFAMSDLHRVVRAVTTTGERGKRFINNSFAIEVHGEEKGDIEYRAQLDPEKLFEESH